MIFGHGSPRSSGLKARLAAAYGILAVLDVGAWLWAFAAFHQRPALLGIALIIYGLGLRQAVGADHIAAIDYVTRKLMQDSKRPIAPTATGRSTVVMVVGAAMASAATLQGSFQSLEAVGGIISTSVSALFLWLCYQSGGEGPAWA